MCVCAGVCMCVHEHCHVVRLYFILHGKVTKQLYVGTYSYFASNKVITCFLLVIKVLQSINCVMTVLKVLMIKTI